MSLQPKSVSEVPAETARVARAAFRKGNPYLRFRDEFGSLFTDQDFVQLYPRRGQPAFSPSQLALVTLVQFAENLTDRRMADQVRARIDLKYLLNLELTDTGFDFSVLSEFRRRLVNGNAETLLLNTMLERFSPCCLCFDDCLFISLGASRYSIPRSAGLCSLPFGSRS
ncbi:transposase [Deinococcus sp. 23YEL01]|nr:transposase [Deinococcus sp. 23YEL01]